MAVHRSPKPLMGVRFSPPLPLYLLEAVSIDTVFICYGFLYSKDMKERLLQFVGYILVPILLGYPFLYINPIKENYSTYSLIMPPLYLLIMIHMKDIMN